MFSYDWARVMQFGKSNTEIRLYSSQCIIPWGSVPPYVQGVTSCQNSKTLQARKLTGLRIGMNKANCLFFFFHI